jgi:hypothetical protein
VVDIHSPISGTGKPFDLVMPSSLRSFNLKFVEIGNFKRDVGLPRGVEC